MSNPISVKVVYKPEDSFRVAKFLRNQNFLYRYDVILTSVIIFVSILGLIAFLADDIASIKIIEAVAFAALAAVVAGLLVIVLHRILHPWLMRRTINKYFESSPSANEETLFSMQDDGISAESESSSSFTKWSAIVKVVESDDDFLFYHGHNFSWFLPKSAFDSINDLNSAKQILKSALVEKVKLLPIKRSD